jgi:hypothetical protein
MGAKEVEKFLTYLAVTRGVVAATQNQALNALVFLYRELLGVAVEGIDAMRAKESKRLPVVLSVEEIRRLLAVMEGEEAVTAKSLQKGEKPDPNATKIDDNETVLPELREAEMLLYRIRYFTAGAMIGSKAFVNEAFAAARARFSAKRKDGAHAMKGAAPAAKGRLWSMRNLRT